MSHSARSLRAAALLVAFVGAGPVTLTAVARPVEGAWSRIVRPDASPDQRMVAGVVLGSALLLVLVWCWLLACVTAEVLEQVARPVTARSSAGALQWTPGWRPQVIGSLVAVLVGTVAAVPADATAHERPGLPAALDGLPLPDRVPAGVPARVARQPLILRVRPGDTLWRLAADRLPAHSGPTVVDRAWRRLYARNRDAVGPDPDLLLPGTRLQVPRGL
ncbi:MAG: hypothetical protein QOK15_2718 [Nocardioidaceae bacterium]|nr:hypothetical protein [Nocardioidaceae bacterium]